MAALNSFKFLLLWRFLLASCIPVLLVGILSVSFIIESSKEHLDRQLATQALSIRKEIQFIIEKPLAILSHMTSGLSAYDFNHDKGLVKRMETIVNSSEIIEALLIVDDHFRVVQVGLPSLRTRMRSEFLDLDLSQDPLLNETQRQGKTTWSDAEPSIINGELSLMVCMPFRNHYLMAILNLNQLHDLTTRLPISTSAEISVIDSRGSVLFQSGVSRNLSHPNLSFLEPVERGLAGVEGGYHYERQGEEYLGNVLKITETGWLVFVSQPKQLVYSEIHYLQNIVLLGGSSCVVLSLLFSLAFARRLSRPMVELKNCVQQMARGELDVEVKIASYSEAQALAMDVKAMGQAIKEREALLGRERDRFHALFNNVSDAVFMCELDRNNTPGLFIEINNIARDSLGYSREELLQMTPRQIDLLFNNADVPHPALASLGTDDQALVETMFLTKHGREIPFEMNLQKLRLDDQDVLVCVARNIAERKQSQRALNALVTSTVGATGKGCFDKILRELCQYFEVDGALIGIPGDTGQIECLSMLYCGSYQDDYTYPIEGSPCERVLQNELCFHPKDLRSQFPHDIDFVQMGIESYFGIPLLNADNHVIGVLNGFSKRPMHLPVDAREVLSIVAARAATELERLQSDQVLSENRQQLSYLAFHDPLTQLPNRLQFSELLDVAMHRTRRGEHNLVLLFIDLDRFKNINDSLGHSIGDKLLQAVGRRMDALLGENETLARLGGDEFAVLMEEVDSPVAGAEQAQRVIDGLCQPFQIDDYSLHISASIGITMFPADAQDPDGLIKCADIAMFKAKDDGRNTYKYYERSMNLKTHELLLLENDLRHALTKQQLVLHYQPQLDLQGGKIVGFEALLRWNHPEKGMISPLEFIPLAEETGLIVAMGEWILLTACRQIRDWNHQYGQQLRIAVNISARQFHHYDLIACIEKVLEQTGIPTSWLELEITESLLMYDIQSSIDTMHRLKELGVRLAIDDFGTGYSSLSYLKKFPISSLKIDKSFVDDILTDASDAAIAESTLALASKMELLVVAEGIEHQQQLDYLKERGCDYGQGYFISRPLDCGQCQQFLDQQFKSSNKD